MTAATLPEVIDSLIKKTARLGEYIEKVERENANLRKRINELEELISEEKEISARARLDADYLTVSHRLADSPDTLIATRRRISSLIRTIDRCISMLKDDPEI